MLKSLTTKPNAYLTIAIFLALLAVPCHGWIVWLLLLGAVACAFLYSAHIRGVDF